MLCMSGIDVSKFSAGSVWPAVTSKAWAAAVAFAWIMTMASWSREPTFAKNYNNIVDVSDPCQNAVLD